jgi:hypothetical protein
MDYHEKGGRAEGLTENRKHRFPRKHCDEEWESGCERSRNKKNVKAATFWYSAIDYVQKTEIQPLRPN